MKIKKKELRKGQAQLPINYPAPDVVCQFDYDREKDRVETICKRLAEVEESVRDDVLAKVPLYLKEITYRYIQTSSSAAVAKKPLAKQSASAIAEANSAQLNKDDEDNLSMIYLKLSYGLFYNYWHSDKPLVQHATAEKIADLQHSIPNAQAADLFVKCFCKILVREWMKIDKWRLDKFMGLVRKFIHQVLRRLISYGEGTKLWEESMERVIYALQFEIVMESAVGLTMHVCDLLLDELIKSGCKDEMFLKMSDGVAIYAMRRGNYVEKRVLDFFVVPLTNGILNEKREEKEGVDNMNVLAGLAQLCQDASVGKGTAYLVRPMLSEAAMLLKQAVEVQQEPDAFEPIHKRDVRLRLGKEVDLVNKTRLENEITKSNIAKKKRVTKEKDGGKMRIMPVGKVMKVKGKNKMLGKNAKSSKRKKIVKLDKSEFMKDLDD